MAASSTLTSDDYILADQYNNLRADVLDAAASHDHTGAADHGAVVDHGSLGSRTDHSKGHAMYTRCLQANNEVIERFRQLQQNASRNNQWYEKDTTTVTFDSAFSSTPVVTATVEVSTNVNDIHDIFISQLTTSAVIVKYDVYCTGTGVTTEVYVHVVAIGPKA